MAEQIAKIYEKALTEIFDNFQNKEVVAEQFTEAVRKKNREIEELDSLERKKQRIIREATAEIDKRIELQQRQIQSATENKKKLGKVLDAKTKAYDSIVRIYRKRFPKLVVNGYKKNPLAEKS